jgi:hypothetical protein
MVQADRPQITVQYGTGKQTTDNSIIWCMLFVCWIIKVTDTHAEYVTLIAAHAYSGYDN